MQCQYCNKICKNGNSFRNHERLCKNNPNKQTTYFQTNIKDIKRSKPSNAWIKAKSLGLPPPTRSEETRKKLSESRRKRSAELNKQIGLKTSETIKRKVQNGEWHSSLAKKMHLEYNGCKFHGTWEVEYAKYLDSKNIKWIRNTTNFVYTFENKKRRYTPDFYLPDTNEYVEIKGYKTLKDEAKWKDFPGKLIILQRKELLKLGVHIKV